MKEGGVHFVDFVPTLLEITGVVYPKTYYNVPTHALAGESFAPILRGGTWARSKPIFYEWMGNRMVRNGKWKLIFAYPQNVWERYDIENDRTETTDLAKANPIIVEEMTKSYLLWAKQNAVSDWTDEMDGKTGSAFKRK